MTTAKGGRYYVGLGGILLGVLACTPKVELGHGDNEGGDSTAGGEPGTPDGGKGGSKASGGSGGSAGGEIGGTGGATGGTDPIGGTGGAIGGSGPIGGTGGGYSGPLPDTGMQQRTGKVDLLLAIDNSISMAEKQQLLTKAMPELVSRLVSPYCVNSSGGVVSRPSIPSANCPAGSAREFAPLRDLHIGVITSSLGSHGASGMKDVCVTAEDDDHAHLLPSVRQGLPSYNNQGYLNWDPDGTSNPPGESDPAVLVANLTQTLGAVGEHGCGYEAQLESVYRFLVDPDPPQSVVVPQGSSQAQKMGTDQTLLTQRDSFLRPDSSVVVLMLSDENDCSIQDEGYGWLVARTSPMYRSTSQCAANPNDKCCQSCGEVSANEGCPAIASDSECQKGMMLGSSDDQLNLRCYDQRRRFGFDLLYPLARYTSGFSGADVPNRLAAPVANPLFHRGKVTRDRSLFTFALLGGVPWQDLATDTALQGGPLEFMTATQLQTSGRWSKIVGDPVNFVKPTDPFMLEQPGERETGKKNPFVNASIVASDSQNPQANPINGHEQINPQGGDLQYACTYELPAPVVCDQKAFDAGEGCDCFQADLGTNSPLCQPPAGGAPTITQYYGKAYPTLRELEVARELGRGSVIGSVCAPNTQDDSRADYGYRPTFGSLGARISTTLLKQ